MKVMEFQTLEKASQGSIKLNKNYVDLTGDLCSGILLSSIVTLSAKGDSRVVERDGERWLAIPRQNWWYECRMSPKQFDRAIKVLEDAGLVVTRVYKLNGTPTKHIKLAK